MKWVWILGGLMHKCMEWMDDDGEEEMEESLSEAA